MKNDKKVADRIERYLNERPPGASDIDPVTKKIVDNLSQTAAREQPRPGYVNELANQLRERNRIMNEQSNQRKLPQLLRFGLGLVGLVALFAVALYAAGLFSMATPEPAIDTAQPSQQESEQAPEPQEVERFEPEEGPLAGHTVQMAATMPDGPQDVQTVVVTARQLPQTPEDALELGRDLGLQNAEVYVAAHDPGAWIVRDETGATLTYQVDSSALSFAAAPVAQPVDGPPITFDEAARIATDFLDDADLLPEAYEVEEERQSAGEALRVVKFIPLIDGAQVIVQQRVTTVAVQPDGAIRYAHIYPVSTSLSDQSVAVKSAQAALDDLFSGQSAYYFNYQTSVSEPAAASNIFYPSLPALKSGDRFSAEGIVHVLVPLTGADPVASLQTARGDRIALAGSAVAELAQQSGSAVTIEGVVREASAMQTTVEVADWQPVPSGSSPPACRMGAFSEDGGRNLFVAENGEQFDLGAMNEKPAAGDDMMVCAGTFSSEQLDWDYAMSPPTGGPPMSGGGGVASATGLVEGSAEATGSTTTMPRLPQAFGESITIQGPLSGYLQRDGDELLPYLLLGVDLDQDLFTPHANILLYGERDLLLDLSEQYPHYVEIQGTVVEAVGGMPGAQAIQVDSFRTSDGLEPQSFLGQVERGSHNGLDVAIFTDETTGESYVLTQDYDGLYDNQRVWLTGIVHTDERTDGVKVIEPFALASGGEIEMSESANDIPVISGIDPIDRQAAPSNGLPEALTIDGIMLVHALSSAPTVEGSAASPAWLISGLSADGQTTFELLVPATP